MDLLLKEIQLGAMGAVVRRDYDSLIRHVSRWYSREFSTPLSEVEDIPLDDLFQAWYEDKYEEMSEEDRLREIERLTLSDTEYYRQQMDASMQDAEAFEMSLEEAARQALEAKKAREKKVSEVQRPPELRPLPETNLHDGSGRPAPPSIEMTFVTDEELLDAAEGDFGDSKKS